MFVVTKHKWRYLITKQNTDAKIFWFMYLRRFFMYINLFANFYMKRYIHWWLSVLKFLSPISHFILILIRCFLLSSTSGFTAWLMLVDRFVLPLTYLYENVQNSLNWFFYISLCLVYLFISEVPHSCIRRINFK